MGDRGPASHPELRRRSWLWAPGETADWASPQAVVALDAEALTSTDAQLRVAHCDPRVLGAKLQGTAVRAALASGLDRAFASVVKPVMLRIEAVGDWKLLGNEDTVSAPGARYLIEIHENGRRGVLRIDSSAVGGAQRVELRLIWPSSTRGSLLVGETRHALDLTPEVVTVQLGRPGAREVLSGFKLTVLPDEPNRKVLPYREMIIALSDGGELATRIKEGEQLPPAPPADREQLQRQICERIAQLYPDPQLQISDDGISFIDAAGRRQYLALDNAWARVRAGETNIVEHFCRLSEPSESNVSAEAIFPLLKAAGTADAFFAQATQIAKRDGGTSEPLVSVSFAPGVECLFVRDLPNGMTFLTRAQLLAAGLDERDLPAHAARQLSRSLTTVLRVEVAPGVHMLACGGNYETALLLLPEIWSELDPMLSSERVVAIPNRDLLFVTSSDNDQGIAWMRQQAASSADRSYPITRELFCWNGSSYQLLEPAKRSWLKRLFS